MTSPLASQPSPKVWLAIFQLCRIPALFSAWGDILLGQGLAHGAVDFSQPRLWWLILATTGLYLSGMVFNDIADRRTDLRERPGRPIPSGRVSLRVAILLSLSLLSLGLISSAVVGKSSVVLGLLIAIAAQSYNFLVKGSLFGCFVMGLCRGGNLLLGASTGLSWPLSDALPVSVAIVYTLYVAGLTWFAMPEAEATIRKQELLGGIYFTTGARILWGLQILTRPLSLSAGAAFALLVTIWIRSVKRLLGIAKAPNANSVQQGVRSLLLVILPQHALLLLGLRGDYWGALVILLMIIPARRLSRLMAIT